MLVQVNYSYKKNQKELAKKRKREEKKQRMLDRKNRQAEADSKPVSTGGFTGYKTLVEIPL